MTSALEQVEIPRDEYTAFLARVKQAETRAREASRGLWANSQRIADDLAASAKTRMDNGDYQFALDNLREIVKLRRADWLPGACVSLWPRGLPRAPQLHAPLNQHTRRK